MASNALECDICCNVFSEDRCPRNFPCSHTFCGPCIDGIIVTKKKTCPTCREEFTATSAEDLMINRSLLDVVRQLSTKTRKPKTLSKGPTGSFPKFHMELRNKLTMERIREKKTRVSGANEILDWMKEVFTATESLKEMKDGLLETKKEIGSFKEMLTDVELSINKIIIEINKSGDQLEAATDLTSIDPFHDAQEKVKEIKDLLQNNQRERDNITKEILQMKRRLKAVAEDVEKVFGRDPAVEEEPRFAAKVVGGKKMLVVADDVERTFGRDPAVEEEPRFAVKVVGGKKMLVVADDVEKSFGRDPAVEEEPALAAKVIRGKKMVAPVRVKPKNQVPLSHFAEGDVPPKSLIVKKILQMKRRLKTVAEDVEKTFGRDPAEEEEPRFAEEEEPRLAAKVVGGKHRLVFANGVEKVFGKDLAVEEEPRFAAKVIGGKKMVAPVRVKPGNQVRLSHFAEGDVPPKSLIVEHEALMKTSSRRAFLDLSVGGTLLERIIIKVVDEGNLALKFLHVCAGDLGPSYANSQLSGVGWKGRDGERINVFTYNSAMKVDWEKEEQRKIYKPMSYKAGEVRGFLDNERASCFYIVTRDNPYRFDNFCFGFVEEGLNALRDAISQYPDITAVRIVDCGLMFPL